jgi:hypothetical protein
MTAPQRSSIGAEIVAGLEDFLAKLKAGEPIPATRVTREDTPDGPLHTQTPVLLKFPQEPVDRG